MGRRVHTAEDVLRAAREGCRELLLGPGERLTPMARDVAAERGIKVLERPAVRTRIHHVVGVSTMELGPFPVDLQRPDMDVRVRDVVGAREGLPLAAGVMSLREGSFPWQLDYDEVEYVVEGELHITTADQRVVGRPGDVIAVPKGSTITFGTPSWAKFLYVTYPADWAGS